MSGAIELLEQWRDEQRARKGNRNWSAGAGGRSALPHPMVGMRQGGSQQPSLQVVQQPQASPAWWGETISLSGTTQDGNNRLEWSTQDSAKTSTGFAGLTLPTTDIPTSVKGYYDVRDLVVELASATGATVTVYAVAADATTRVVGSYTGPSTWKTLDPHDFALDVLDGESIRVVVDQPVTGTFYGNFRLVEQSRVVAAADAATIVNSFGDTFSDDAGSRSITITGDVSAGDVLLVAIAHTASSFASDGQSLDSTGAVLLGTGTASGGIGSTTRHSLYELPVDAALLSAGTVDYTISGASVRGSGRVECFILRGGEVDSIERSGPNGGTVNLTGAAFAIGMASPTTAANATFPTISPSRTLVAGNAGAGDFDSKLRLWSTPGDEADTISSNGNTSAWHVKVA